MRIVAVLGPNWRANVDGKDLANSVQAFREEIDTQTVFKRWLDKAQQLKSFNQDISIFNVESGVKKQTLSLVVNFDEK